MFEATVLRRVRNKEDMGLFRKSSLDAACLNIILSGTDNTKHFVKQNWQYFLDPRVMASTMFKVLCKCSPESLLPRDHRIKGGSTS